MPSDDNRSIEELLTTPPSPLQGLVPQEAGQAVGGPDGDFYIRWDQSMGERPDPQVEGAALIFRWPGAALYITLEGHVHCQFTANGWISVQVPHHMGTQHFICTDYAPRQH